MDSATVGSVVGFVHHGTAGWNLCRDIQLSNSLLGWRNCSLNSPLAALVGDTQRIETPTKALQALRVVRQIQACDRFFKTFLGIFWEE